MAPPIYFISDLHFHIDRTKQDDEKVSRLRSLFEDIRAQQSDLYIVGDLFDFWFEYQYVIPRQHFDLLVLLYELTQAGINVHYLAGNHDYWANTFFSDDLGIELHPDPIELVRGGKRLWICHGDGILSNDSGYRAMKRLFRHPWIIKLFGLIHQGYDYVLMGHFHHPYLKRHDDKIFVNLGDWMHYYSFAIFDKGELTLNYFPSPSGDET